MIGGDSVGQNTAGGRTSHSFLHTGASEMLELALPHALAALWIGDEIETFMDTYGKPTVEKHAEQALARPLA